VRRALWLLIGIWLLGPVLPGWGMEELRILSGGHVTPPSIVERFEKKHRIRIKIENFESHEALAAYLEARPRGDLALLRGHYVDYLRENNQLAPINHALLPNLKNLWPQAFSMATDVGCTHSIPYLYGTLGILYRSDLFGGRKPNWSSIFDRGAGSTPFAVTDQYRDAIGVALMHLGFSYNASSPVAIGQAAENLRDLTAHPAFMGFLNVDGTLRFFREKFIYLAVTYSNIAVQAMEEDSTLDYVTPEREVLTWAYVYVINRDSTKVEAAHKWLDFLLEPEVAAEVSAWNKGASPNKAALPFIPDEIRNNPIIYPPGSIWHDAQFPLGIGVEAEKLMIEYWSRIK